MSVEISTAIYGVELSASESQELFDWISAHQGDPDIMLSIGIDQNDADVDGIHFNPGYEHAVGVSMGESTFADTRKLALKPPSKFAKRFASDCSAALAAIGATRRPKGILVVQTRKD